jgi:hypothetical protein
MTRAMPRMVRRATHLALSWTRWYTRDLAPAIAGDRRDEIASDVWEQAAGQADRPAAALAASIVGRVVRGIPADLAWRWKVRPATTGVQPPLIVRSAVATAVVLWVLELGFGALALVRLGIGLGRGEPLPSETTVASALAGMLVLVVGLALVARPRTRPIGLLALGLGAAVVVHFASLTLVTLSAILGDGYVRIVVMGPSGFGWWVLLVGALAAFPALVAISESVPSRRARS